MRCCRMRKCARLARMRANGVGNAHAHYYSRDCGWNFAPPSCEVEGAEMPVGDVGKCLGYW